MTRGLLARLAQHDRLVEVGIGNRPDVAGALAQRGCSVTATDVRDRAVPDGVAFARDDVTDPDLSVYRGADAVYALRCPPELQRPAREVARRVDAIFHFTTLGADPAVVPATPTALEDVTLFSATDEPTARRGAGAGTRAGAGGRGGGSP